MRVVVTCGPSYEPIDRVRRITNFSTGQLGMVLGNELAGRGHEVLCFRGVSATCPETLIHGRPIPFTTNDDLLRQLAAIPDRDSIGAFFHTAALCDYQVGAIHDSQGQPLGGTGAKLASRSGEIVLRLQPAPKLIAELRTLFPKARLVGWKYELEGSREEALAKAWRQIEENRTDACVINGEAFGPGFGWCEPEQPLLELANKRALAEWIGRWLA